MTHGVSSGTHRIRERDVPPYSSWPRSRCDCTCWYMSIPSLVEEDRRDAAPPSNTESGRGQPRSFILYWSGDKSSSRACSRIVWEAQGQAANGRCSDQREQQVGTSLGPQWRSPRRQRAWRIRDSWPG
ncbi:hypothetical protein BDZ90DRAFT_44406 [Jaminaea rosea]|uniref:Uncharacterized protein n=1 Tax=Jaminaea rosea TaxID=1569628 RepID=A0A316UU59_9BASI|nr:hypothetical protein BDZ90DRAFT_44406 [Jaminaea rosea]PWN26635.1 hypothetical protein BDZ90DRAFT_44406 [Jaminaea rosea]